MTAQLLSDLDANLKLLYLAAIRQRYGEQAQVAAQEGWPYERYLADLVAAEIERRTRNRLQRRIQEARFPLTKELADFVFDQVPQLNRQQVLALAQGGYLAQAESILLVGNPGLGKPQPIHCPYRCDIFFRADCHGC